MISHSNKFKSAFTDLGRELYVKIMHYAVVYNLETEDEKLILTQNNLELLTEDMEGLTPVSELTNDDIISLNKNNLGELFRTYMKSFDLETTHRFNVGDKMIINIGCKVDDDIEYLNYGKYYVYSKEYNEDKKTFTYTLCDKMLFTMIPYDNSAVFEDNDTMTCQEVVNKILTICNIPYQLSTFVNGDKVIYKETFDGVQMTYRDVLDMIMQSQGCSLVVEYDAENDIDKIIDKSYNSSVVDTIDENILSDKNIKVKEKFGKINSLLFKRASGTDNIERKDQEAINRDGICQYCIEDNLILDQENRVDYIDNLFNKIRNIEYYECDIDTIGIGYIEYLDLFELRTPDSIYKCLCLKNTAQVSNGYKESFTTESPIDTTQEYISGGIDDKVASITMDKLKGTIVLKTYVEDNKTKLAQVRLDSSGEEGSLVEIGADNIRLEGYTTINDGFSIDLQGNVELKSGSIELQDKSASQPSIIIHDNQDREETEIYGGNIRINGTQSQYVYIKGNQISINDYDNYITNFLMQIDKSGYCESPSLDIWSCYMTYDGKVGAMQYDNISLEGRKKDFEKYDESALDIIKNIDIYKYRYKNEEDETKKHIGLVIGDNYKYSKEITNDKNDGVDLYSFISVCCKAIQEQQEQIEELKEEINKLKEVK